jgi:hypothetical protein
MNGLVYGMRSNAATGWSFPSHSQRLLTDTLLPAATLRIQEDKISSLRRRGCHGKRFDTFVTPYLAGPYNAISYWYELALFSTN